MRISDLATKESIASHSYAAEGSLRNPINIDEYSSNNTDPLTTGDNAEAFTSLFRDAPTSQLALCILGLGFYTDTQSSGTHTIPLQLSSRRIHLAASDILSLRQNTWLTQLLLDAILLLRVPSLICPQSHHLITVDETNQIMKMNGRLSQTQRIKP